MTQFYQALFSHTFHFVIVSIFMQTMASAKDSRQFRCIDVDAYDEEAYQDDKSGEIIGTQDVSCFKFSD